MRTLTIRTFAVSALAVILSAASAAAVRAQTRSDSLEVSRAIAQQALVSAARNSGMEAKSLFVFAARENAIRGHLSNMTRLVPDVFLTTTEMPACPWRENSKEKGQLFGTSEPIWSSTTVVVDVTLQCMTQRRGNSALFMEQIRYELQRVDGKWKVVTVRRLMIT